MSLATFASTSLAPQSASTGLALPTNKPLRRKFALATVLCGGVATLAWIALLSYGAVKLIVLPVLAVSAAALWVWAFGF